MKLGVAGIINDWSQVTPATAKKVRDMGFRGASIFFNRPLETPIERMAEVKSILQDANLECAQANGWYEVLVNPDERLRAEGIRGVAALCRLGRKLDAYSVYVRPGSLNPNGAWYPHPQNTTPEVFDRLVDSLKQTCAAAEAEGVILAVEGHVLSPLDTPRRVRDLIDAVGSKALMFNMDAVNFMGTVRDVYENGRVLHELFDLLGPYTIAGHMKDLALQDELIVHIQEVVIGTGVLDYNLLMRLLQETCPTVYALIEHLPEEKVPQARAGLLRVAGQENIAMEV
jgi:sugar phosphate isomerase/epimerase